MTNYTSMYRSNLVPVDEAGVKALLDEVEPLDGLAPEEYPLMYEVDGKVEINDGKMWLGSHHTSFAVWDGDYSVQRTRDFLNELAEFIEKTLVIRSVGFTDLQHMPDAYQFIVSPDGGVEMEALEMPD